jgi:hypothetical protein
VDLPAVDLSKLHFRNSLDAGKQHESVAVDFRYLTSEDKSRALPGNVMQ